METPNHHLWWQAVLTRDKRFDAVFVYGVESTGIYCRPSCPARRPHENQVRFFAGSEEAVAAGFRPCRRCSPDKADIESPPVMMVRRLCRFIDKYDHPDRRLTLAVMSDYCKVSPQHLQRTFTRIMGVSPQRYAQARRLERLKGLIRKGGRITDALYEAGYGSGSRLYEEASSRLGMTPGAYARGGRGMRIAYAVTDSPLGRLLVAATHRGVSAVFIGESDEILENELVAEYPSAEIIKDGSDIGNYIDAVHTFIEGGRHDLDLPLDVLVTAFQARVFMAIRDIPYGTIRTYGEIAAQIGSPGASRAVGNACAANPAALIIPCHRVVPAGGGLGGYRWGMSRKDALLKKEHEDVRHDLFEDGAGI